MKHIASFLALFSVSQTLQARWQPAFGETPLAIVNGETVVSGDPVARHTVRLRLGRSYCSGTLIASDLVLTAAHCFKHRPSMKDMQVLFGADERSPALPVRGFVVHEEFREREEEKDGPGGARDIALLHFDGDAPENFGSVPILDDSSRLLPGTRVILAGFGRAVSDDPNSGGVLRKVSTQVLRQLNSGEIEVSSRAGGSCIGDSGGPGFVDRGGRLFLYGVISRGDGACAEDEVHTRVDSFRAWIRTNTSLLRN